MSMIKAILLDMDGVLIDAREWHYESLNRALALFGLEISRYEHLQVYDGLPTKKKLELLSKEKKLPVGLHSFVSELKQCYTIELIHKSCKPVFAHQMMLSRLKADGYKLVVCSNSIRGTMNLMLEKAGLLGYLDFVLSNEDVKKSKPDPEIYLTAMNRLGIAASESLIVEDNPHGIEAAQASKGNVLHAADPSVVNYEFVNSRILALKEVKERAQSSPSDGR